LVSVVGAAPAVALLFAAAAFEFEALLAVLVFVPILNEHAVAREAIKRVKRKRAFFICTLDYTNFRFA
jgi:hypothetical protein